MKYFLCGISNMGDVSHEWMDTSNYILYMVYTYRGGNGKSSDIKLELEHGMVEIGICYSPRHIASPEVIYTNVRMVFSGE